MPSRDFFIALGVLARLNAVETARYLLEVAEEIEAECSEANDDPALLRLCQDNDGFWQLCSRQCEKCRKAQRVWRMVTEEGEIISERNRE